MKTTYAALRPLSAAAWLPLSLAKKILLLCAMFALAGYTELHAGIQWWDPDGDPSNNGGITAGLNYLAISNQVFLLANPGAGLGAVSPEVTVPLGPITWESPLWTDDSNVPTSLTNALLNFNEGDDVIFWGVQATSSSPDITLQLNASHTVNSLSFYTELTAGTTTYNYQLSVGSSPCNLTNVTGVIICDGGALSYANGWTLESEILVPYYSTNGFQHYGSGNVPFHNYMGITGGGPIIVSGVTRPGGAGGLTLPTLAQWNTTLNGPYQPFPINSQIIITNGGVLSLGGSGANVTSSVPVIIWDGTVSGSGAVYAPEIVIRTCRFGNNAMASTIADYGVGGTNTIIYKTGPEYFGFSTGNNTYKGITIISQGAVLWVEAAGGAAPPATATSCLSTNTIILGDTNTGSFDIGLCRFTTAPSTANTNLWNNIVVTTNGTGRVFIGNQAMAGVVRLSGNISLGRSVILGGSGDGVNSLDYYPITARGCICDGIISGAGGVTVEGASGLFSTTLDPAWIANPGNSTSLYSTSVNLWSGGTVKLTNPNNSYAGGSTVYWGTLEAGANGSLGTGNVTVVGPGVLQLDTIRGIASTANLVMANTATSNALVNLNYPGTCTINALSTNGGVTYVTAGTWGPVDSTAVNQSASFIGTGILNVVNPSTNTTTTLASSLNPANLNTNYGMSVTFTATVASVTTGTPTGTVTFNNGATVLGTGLLSGGVATFTTNNLPAGTNAITASYSDDAYFLPSASSALLQVIYTNLSTTNVALDIASTAPGTFSLSFQGTPGAYYSVVTSTNVAAPMTNWTVVPGSTTLVTDLVAGSWGITVTNTSAARYYRAKVAGIAP